MHSRALFFSALVCLSACGGSSSFDAPLPAQINLPPVFIGGDVLTLNVPENIEDRVTLILASDPNADTITIALSDASDGALFSFDGSSGALGFRTPPNFERPQDGDADNVYIVTMTATDPSGLETSQRVEITVTDETDTPALKRIGTGFDRPLGLIPLPGDTRLAVIEQGGRIRLLNPADGQIEAVDFLTVTDLGSANSQGLLGLAFAPDFETSGLFYVNLTRASDGRTEIRQYEAMSGRRDMGDPATENLILGIDQPFANHNAGWIGFAQDGSMIIPMGDGGSRGDPQNFAQNAQSLLGKILRIDVTQDGFPADPARNYAIPAGNAFTDTSDGLPEIYAVGVRNPFQSTLDPATGDLLFGDVGQAQREEINRLSLTGSAGTNFGWRIKEGTEDFNLPDDGIPANLTPPAAEYGREETDRGGRSVTGGIVYQGDLESLEDQYVFGDFVSGNLWALPVDNLGNTTTLSSESFTVLTPEIDIGETGNISAFATGPDGTAYIVSYGGDIFELVAAD